MTAPTLTDDETISDMLGRVVDPLNHVRRGDSVTADQLRPGGTNRDRCSQDYHPYGSCARSYGHPAHWQHIALAGGANSGVVVATWNEDRELDESAARAETTEEETPLLDVKPGTMCRFRQRRDLLMILGRTKKGADTVEALNLTRQRFCRLKIDRLVERKPTDPNPTQEQMAWVAEFLADRKRAIGQVGLREVESRRWSRKEMETSLGKADLTPPPVRWSGRADIGITFQLPAGAARPDNDSLLRLINEAIGSKLAELSTEGISLKAVAHAMPTGLVAG